MAATDLAFDITGGAGGVYVVGHISGTIPGEASAGGYDGFVRKFDAGGNLVWTEQFGSAGHDCACSIIADGDDIYLAGYTDGTFPGETGLGRLRHVRDQVP